MKAAGKGTTTAERGGLCEEGLQEDLTPGKRALLTGSSGAQQQEQDL